MKIGMKEEIGVANKMTSSVLGLRAHSARNFARSAQIHSFSWFWGEKLQLELLEGHENWYEGGDGRCRQNDIFRFGSHVCSDHKACKSSNFPSNRFLHQNICALV